MDRAQFIKLMIDLIQAVMVIPDDIFVIGITPYGAVPVVQVRDDSQALEWVKSLDNHDYEVREYADCIMHFYKGDLPCRGESKTIRVVTCRREDIQLS